VIAQAAATVVRDTVRIVDTVRVVHVDTVWVAAQAGGGGHDLVDYATALSTVAVAVFALVALAREVWLARQKRKAVDAQITAVAYALQRQLKSWLVDPVSVDIAWANGLTNRQAGQKSHFDIAEERLDLLMRDAPFASREPRQAVYSAFLLFNAATKRISETLADFGKTNIPNYAELRGPIVEQLSACIEALDGAIDRSLREEESRLLLAKP
jgi:hypothetical protein